MKPSAKDRLNYGFTVLNVSYSKQCCDQMKEDTIRLFARCLFKQQCFSNPPVKPLIQHLFQLCRIEEGNLTIRNINQFLHPEVSQRSDE